MRVHSLIVSTADVSRWCRGAAQLIVWLRKHKIGQVVMEASGGYERDWAKALREAACQEARVVSAAPAECPAASAACPEVPVVLAAYQEAPVVLA